ncbi:MAG: D-alanyl-D-alanine carboxypeptidase/D-alanyl-D-alanine endopeptidase [Terriglobia bacterium]
MINPNRSRCNLPFALVLITLVFCAPSEAAKRRRARIPRALGPHINYILRQTSAQRGFWGIEVMRLRDGKILFKQNADHLFMPASNMKLFTTAAALEELGPNFVFRTTVESAIAPDAQGRVGDLILVGRGDANLGSRVLPYHLETERKDPADRVFRELADQVAARGVREVQGNLVADDSYFLFEPYGHDWAEEDLEWGYGAPVTALAFNDNELLFHVQPAAAVGETALVSLAPIGDYYRLNNRLVTSDADSKEEIFVERVQGSRQLEVWGQVPLGSIVEDDSVSIDNPPQLVGDIFLKLLEDRGIHVRGNVVVKHFTRLEAATMPSPAPALAGRVILAEHDSPGLREDIKVTNKVSQNLHAEMLLRTLGHEVKNYGSLTTGLDVLREFVKQVGIPADDFYFVDGSGLSRQALVAPEAVVKILQYMTHSPYFDAYFKSLPVAGVDGTLDHRFMGTSAIGAIHAKTGTITHVNSLSGYMDLPSGGRLAFSIFGNSNPASARLGARTADQIALAIFEKYAGRRRVVRKRSAKRVKKLSRKPEIRK